MGDDLRFTKMVQAKIVSCVAIFREQAPQSFFPNGSPQSGGGSARDEQFGERTTDSNDGRVFEELAPGAHILGRPGEKLQGFSPDVPNESFFQHSNLLLTFVAINLNLPLIVLMLDSTATNFSGYRGALDMARGSYSRMQKGLVNRFHRPVYIFKLKQFLSEPGNQALRSAYEKIGRKRFLNHEWNAPGWRYIQPTEDAAGDILQARNGLNSMRRLQAARGQVWEKIAPEITGDNDTLIRCAADAYLAFKEDPKYVGKDLPVEMWHFISLPTPDRVSASIDLGSPKPAPAASPSRQPQEANAE
jgi:capsid protein